LEHPQTVQSTPGGPVTRYPGDPPSRPGTGPRPGAHHLDEPPQRRTGRVLVEEFRDLDGRKQHPTDGVEVERPLSLVIFRRTDHPLGRAGRTPLRRARPTGRGWLPQQPRTGASRLQLLGRRGSPRRRARTRSPDRRTTQLGHRRCPRQPSRATRTARSPRSAPVLLRSCRRAVSSHGQIDITTEVVIDLVLCSLPARARLAGCGARSPDSGGRPRGSHLPGMCGRTSQRRRTVGSKSRRHVRNQQRRSRCLHAPSASVSAPGVTRETEIGPPLRSPRHPQVLPLRASRPQGGRVRTISCRA